jgi:hypothetical protein
MNCGVESSTSPRRSATRTHIYTGQRRNGEPDRRSLVRPAFIPPLTVSRTAGWIKSVMATFWLGFVLWRSPHVGRLNRSNAVKTFANPAHMCSLHSALASLLRAARKRSISASPVLQPRLTRTSTEEVSMAASTWKAVLPNPDNSCATDSAKTVLLHDKHVFDMHVFAAPAPPKRAVTGSDRGMKPRKPLDPAEIRGSSRSRFFRALRYRLGAIQR